MSAFAPRNSTDGTIIKLALMALFVALAAKSRTNGAPPLKPAPRPKPKRWLQVL